MESDNKKQDEQITIHNFDVIVIGAGGAGMVASLTAQQKGSKVACISKVHPLRSNTVMAQGGIAATLASIEEDKIEWHIFDTIQAGVGLCNKEAVEILCNKANETIAWLENIGVPFSRTESGKIAQRRFGGMTKNYGESLVSRACYASNKTGHAILHTLYSTCLCNGIQFFSEFLAIDLIKDNTTEAIKGILALELKTGKFHAILGSAIVFATGGYTQVFSSATSSTTCTGDGSAILLRAGLGIPMMDIEFVQFHPTGLEGSNRLISEAVRGEGGYLTNNKGEKFMQKYSPTKADLATRDVISRAIINEIKLGNGFNKTVNLNAQHLPQEVWNKRLSSIAELAKTFANKDPTKEPLRVLPVAHYCMGGIPTNINCEILNQDGELIKGLFAAGEIACLSTHGANRLGSNSLLEIIVFGKIAGEFGHKFASVSGKESKEKSPEGFEENPTKEPIEKLNGKPKLSFTKELELLKQPTRLLKELKEEENTSINIEQTNAASIIQNIHKVLTSTGTTNPYTIKIHLQQVMNEHCGIIKNKQDLQNAEAKINQLIEQFADVSITDRGLIWNVELINILEIHNLLIHASLIIKTSLAREESRGSHYREDFTQLDANARHSFALVQNFNKGFLVIPTLVDIKFTNH